jgi:hypothetical protein
MSASFLNFSSLNAIGEYCACPATVPTQKEKEVNNFLIAFQLCYYSNIINLNNQFLILNLN